MCWCQGKRRKCYFSKSYIELALRGKTVGSRLLVFTHYHVSPFLMDSLLQHRQMYLSVNHLTKPRTGHLSQNIKMRPWSPTRTSVTCFPTCGEHSHLHRFRRFPTCKVRTSWFWGPWSEITDPSSCSSSSSFSCSASLPGTWMHPRHSKGCSVVGEREKVSSILLLQKTGFKY